MARALTRSLPSGKELTTSASTAGEASAPPTPWVARAARTKPAAGARPPAPAAAEDVARPAAQQQQPAEGQRVPVHHPRQVGRGEVQAVLDMRQRDVHHG